MKLSTTSLIAALVLASITLTGCDAPHDDIDAFLKNPGVSAKKIEKLPSTKAFPEVQYYRNQVRDPFIANLSIGGATMQEPPVKEEDLEPLEKFPLDSLAMIGIGDMDGKDYALIRDPEHQVHRVQLGMRMGLNYGKVIQISRAGVQLEEQVRDGAGVWTKVPAKLQYNESNKLTRAKK